MWLAAVAWYMDDVKQEEAGCSLNILLCCVSEKDPFHDLWTELTINNIDNLSLKDFSWLFFFNSFFFQFPPW